MKKCWDLSSSSYVTEPAKTGHVGTKYALLLSESYHFNGIEYFYSVILLQSINCKQAVKFHSHTIMEFYD